MPHDLPCPLKPCTATAHGSRPIGRVEAGVESAEATVGCVLGLNLKCTLVTETDHRPAVAIDPLGKTDSVPLSDWHVALARDVGDVRLHAGPADDGANRGMLGLEYQVTPRALSMADGLTGHEAYLTGGPEYEFKPDLTAPLVHGRANTLAEDDIAGLGVLCHGS